MASIDGIPGVSMVWHSRSLFKIEIDLARASIPRVASRVAYARLVCLGCKLKISALKFYLIQLVLTLHDCYTKSLNVSKNAFSDNVIVS